MHFESNVSHLRDRVNTVARRLIYCTTSLAGPGMISRARMVNQTVHPSEVVKLVAVGVRMVDRC